MKQTSYTLEFITPCFCAGAEQAKAELRAPSIRGKLRWWFRALGGTREQENSIFGGVSGNEGGTASKVQIRVREIKRGSVWTLPSVDPNKANAYVYYFASVSGKKPGTNGSGPRWKSDGVIPPGTQFELLIRETRLIESKEQVLLQKTIECFLYFGSIGLRSTRGLGAFSLISKHENLRTQEACLETLKESRFEVFEHRETRDKWESMIDLIGGFLKNDLRKGLTLSAGKNNNIPSPLGCSSLSSSNNAAKRQSSAVYLRPIRSDNSKLKLLAFETPHDRILDLMCRKPEKILSGLSS